ncbi:MAG: VWA domain-containing protein [Treponema sp.]|jgi:Mg-chelatase subunit ChlD|nr:VWA domain-containing protein [Treponema sp.]
MKKSVPLALMLAFFLSSPASAQNQADPAAAKRDICVILDVSGSMKEERKFAGVQEYLEREIVGDLMKPGDSFTLITFGDSAAELFSRSIASEADKAALLGDLRKVEADNDYTDIGAALEALDGVLEGRQAPGHAGTRQLILFITDGKNTPPRDSPYYGKDLAVDDRFKSVGEKIARGGWFLYIIGIGGETDVRKIADAVEGSVYQNTDPALSDLELDAYVEKVEEDARAREAAAAAEIIPAADAADGRAARGSGAAALLDKLSAFTGLSAAGVLGIAAGIIVLLLAALFLLFRAFRSVEITLDDGKVSLSRKLGPFGGVVLNSPGFALPGVGGEDRRILRVERGFAGLKIRVLDGGDMAEKSPYKKTGLYAYGGAAIELRNGKKIQITRGPGR